MKSSDWAQKDDRADLLLTVPRRLVLESLSDCDGLTPAQVAEETGQTTSAARQLLKSMTADNQVEKKGQKYFPCPRYERVETALDVAEAVTAGTSFPANTAARCAV